MYVCVCMCVEFFFPDFPSFISRFYFIAQTEHFINCQQNDENIGNFSKIANQLKLNQLKFTLQLLVYIKNHKVYPSIKDNHYYFAA